MASAADIPVGLGAAEHGLSIDVEDYRQILSARYRGEAGPVTTTFERNMETVCAMLAEARTKATFFVSGLVAAARPDLVRRWADLGHEIASHGLTHEPIWTMTPERFRQELSQAKRTLEDAAGRAVAGYRAPVFSVRRDTLWALEAIREAGFAYDSSIVPVRMRRYGVAGFGDRPQAWILRSGDRIIEVPLTTVRACGMRVPLGGGYLRLVSHRVIRRAVASAEAGGRAIVVFAHPDEFGTEPFQAVDLATGWRDKAAAAAVALKSNLGRRRIPVTIRWMLGVFRFSILGRIAARA
jgi:polysaccharide deacetylase family protein (PEP-CTERM system associated)